MGFENYHGSVKLGSGLTPQGGASFALMQSCDIMVDNNGKRLDKKLDELTKTAVPIPISTEAEMNAILKSATEVSIGAIYRYTGTTTDTYENGALYVIASDISNGDGVSY